MFPLGLNMNGGRLRSFLPLSFWQHGNNIITMTINKQSEHRAWVCVAPIITSNLDYNFDVNAADAWGRNCTSDNAAACRDRFWQRDKAAPPAAAAAAAATTSSFLCVMETFQLRWGILWEPSEGRLNKPSGLRCYGIDLCYGNDQTTTISTMMPAAVNLWCQSLENDL